MPKLTYVCSICGSENVKCDAWVAWSVTAQSWEVADVFDDSWCDDCDGEASLKAVEAFEARESSYRRRGPADNAAVRARRAG